MDDIPLDNEPPDISSNPIFPIHVAVIMLVSWLVENNITPQSLSEKDVYLLPSKNIEPEVTTDDNPP